MAKGMDQYIPKLQVKEVDADHWAQLERRDEVNEVIMNWLSELKRPVSSL